MKKTLMALVVLLTIAVVSCTKDIVPAEYKSLEGTWVADLTGRTHSIWNFGTCWNVWNFQTDGTGVCDVFYTVGEEPVAIEHQPFTYTANEGTLYITMADGPWDEPYQIKGGRLTIGGEGDDVTFDKADAVQTARFDEWSRKELVDVPGTPADYTVFVYGNAGGNMDNIIETGFWDTVKPYLVDSTKVRVVCLYKYGKGTNSKYAQEGDVVWFELNSETDLENIRENSLQAVGFSAEALALKLYSPDTIRAFMEISSLKCPAKEYIFTIWGHGNGFEAMYDVPNKFDDAATRGLIGDEWNNREKLDMYELSDAIRSTGLDRLNAIFFHNCVMGNMESLTELRDVTDYICCSSHVLCSDGTILREYIRGLIDTGNTEDAVAQMIERSTPYWQRRYEYPEGPLNGDLKLIRASKLDAIVDACKPLADRLLALYPTQKEAIDRATVSVYRYHLLNDDPVNGILLPMFDLADYAHKLARETGDAEFASISSALDRALDDAFIHYVHVNNSVDHLDHYSLSVCLFDQFDYTYDFIAAGNPYRSNLQPSYEQCTFHKRTGWGNWLITNTCRPWGNPYNGGGGQL